MSKENEVVSYLAGEVYDYPFAPQLLTDSAICSAGRLLRDFPRPESRIPLLFKWHRTVDATFVRA